MAIYDVSPDWSEVVLRTNNGAITSVGNWYADGEHDLSNLLERSANAGSTFTTPIVSTFSMAYTGVSAGYSGGVLNNSGDIYLVNASASSIGQKISNAGVVSTFSVIANGFSGGVLDPSGNIHFVPNSASVGQKISPNGTVSTYSLVYTTSSSYNGGVLAPNGDIHFVPGTASVGQKISRDGVVSTYSLVYTTNSAFGGGILKDDGDIYFIMQSGIVGQKVTTGSALPFSFGVCVSPFFNKF